MDVDRALGYLIVAQVVARSIMLSLLHHAGACHDGLKEGEILRGGYLTEQARGGSTGGERGDAAQTGDAGQEKESEERVEARRALSKAGREKRDERDEQGKGHVATVSRCSGGCRESRWEGADGCCPRVWSRRGGGRRCGGRADEWGAG